MPNEAIGGFIVPLDAVTNSANPADQLGRQNVLPASGLLIDSFRDDSACPMSSWRVPLRAAGRLAVHHGDQWSAEMISRDPNADDHVVAAAKRSIDLLNRVRVDLVTEIDTWVDRVLDDPGTGPLHTETIGSVIDRLAIAWVRCQRLIDHEAQERSASQADAALRQFRELARAYDDLVRDAREGCRRIPRWRALKSYGERR
ncbi:MULTISPECIES: DUF4254 domain-containing protein [unclassified Micromonospora]|uniref:DUF4254 domain-containing protein n=1 Tax=unclassified Micromonospora TaxID=2617518 RepID=UPI00098D6445|nr:MULTISPECIES: DUF4254 domain-containing protein [unclassified Micromonospora]MDI5936732.1 DUF4254 domain-containing protein [Micromonospora sp. DH15]